MSKLKRNKIPISIINEDDLIKIGVEQGVIESEFNWKLVREYDGLTKQSKEVMWIEWNKDGTFKKKHDTFGVGFSLIMSPFNQFFTWQTTPLIDVVDFESELSYIKFTTKNSIYTLTKRNTNYQNLQKVETV